MVPRPNAYLERLLRLTDIQLREKTTLKYRTATPIIQGMIWGGAEKVDVKAN